ncbi:hypothetical protein EI94DRAFT_1761542 [Lactarius quietus]|nr:hypothetical protein EI94DRAFT_1761542 [Lactarius quietus]
MGNTNSTTDSRLAEIRPTRFRVLIIGRANAGKTSILQRLCDTTDSPDVYPNVYQRCEHSDHDIDDQIVFSNHNGYIFHDSCGFEAGSDQELRVVQEFIRKRSGKEDLQDRIHVIWYCVPMDNQRPELDLRHFKDICPDHTVPVIAVFTKYDQFVRNVEMHLEDYGNPEDSMSDAVERQFNEHFLRHLGDGVRFV